MKTLFIGSLVFLVWGVFSNYWYVCKIKGLCGSVQAIQIVENIPSEANIKEDIEDRDNASTALDNPEEKFVIENNTFYFPFDESDVINEDDLQKAFGELEDMSGENILLEGYTCNIGTEEYNYALGQRRARAVKEFLVSKGYEEDKISLKSYGENKPAVPNTSEENREENRRVEIVLTKKHK